MPSLSVIRPLYIFIITAVAAVGGLLASSVSLNQFEMQIESSNQLLKVDELFTATITVRSGEPTNVFSGTVVFDSSYLVVDKIDYNTSIADLWAVEPWYAEGDGTITFAGGSTQPGGYTGEGTLLTVTFRPIRTGVTDLGIDDVRILRHDGLGTEVNENTTT